MSRSRAIIRSRSETTDRRNPRNSTKHRPRTISTAGAACGHRIPQKPTLIGLKTIQWAAGTAPVGIGIRISPLIPSFRETESSTARSAGASIRPSACTTLRLAFTATTTIISVPTGIAGAAVNTTMLTTTTAPIVALVAITDTAASIVETTAGRTGTWATKVASTMVMEGSMVKEAFTMAVGFTKAEAFTVVEALTVAAGGGIAKT